MQNFTAVRRAVKSYWRS